MSTINNVAIFIVTYRAENLLEENIMFYPFFEKDCEFGDKNYMGWDWMQNRP